MTTFSSALERGGRLAAEARQSPNRTDVSLELDGVGEPCILHWGVGRGPDHWLVPPASQWPSGSRAVDAAAVDTPFPTGADRARLTIALDASSGYTTLDFVLFFPSTGRWDNNRGRDYHVPLTGGGAAAARAGGHEPLVQQIVEGEKGNHSWTLMHRFNLCYDLLDRVGGGDTDGLALLFVWLRFSAIRQLDWQRNYNTKPRELAHSQDRLTLKLAARVLARPDERQWLRLIMGTVGRGGEGQRVRDEVLNIMHRHHIKEVSGHFMEEWHQKLHNNTTPDDVAICEAYLAFLRNNGDRDMFYRTLEAAGVSRARLQGYERPIRSEPDFIPHLKDALIHDFEEFLQILNRLHSGTDLRAAIDDAGAVLDEHLRGLVEWVAQHRGGTAGSLEDLVARITDARRTIAERLTAVREAHQVRAFVYLDLALEELLRLSIERQLQSPAGLDPLLALVAMAIENALFTQEDNESRMCERQWKRVQAAGRDEFWPLITDAASERVARAAASLLDRYQQTLQPRAEMLGRAFAAETWTIAGFSEEVIRGRPAVVLPVLARLLRRELRRIHRLPTWQIISGRDASGVLEIADTLESIQGARFERPTIVLASHVGGQEEIAVGVSAVVTSQDVDVLSHLGIRARNAGVLFATCQDEDEVDRLRKYAGREITLVVNASGGLDVKAGTTGGAGSTTAGRANNLRQFELRRAQSRRDFPGWVVTSRDFSEVNVGSKARNLVRLEGHLPQWVRLPPSLAIPFGAFERTLNDVTNAHSARLYEELVGRLRVTEDAGQRRVLLRQLRDIVTGLAAPAEVPAALAQAHLPVPDFERAWLCVKQVWASKWNDRAVLSRAANGIGDEDVTMSVLVQPVVEADRAFVIHTASPATGNRDELHAEVVLGLGETLVGNYPGRALSLTWRKRDGDLDVIAFPSKTTGLFGGGLIFRSDSNAEDLSEYAGAGLYDSVMLTPPRAVVLDYAGEPLVWDRDFRREFAHRLADIGIQVEQALGAPQDIEGACAGSEWFALQSRPQVGVRHA